MIRAAPCASSCAPSTSNPLPYLEVQVQLQLLEHAAQKGPLSKSDLAFERQPEARDHELVQAKLAQSFDDAPRSKDDADNAEAWKKAAEHHEFRSKAERIARDHLREEAELADKRQQDIHKLGPSAELDAVYAGQLKLQARHYDEDRGRYAREFLKTRELDEEIEQREKQNTLEPGKDLEP